MLVLAAVAGRRFDFELLQELTGQDESELLRLIKELIAAQLVVEVERRGDQFAFRHALTRETVYQQLLGRERRGLHRRIAETLEQLFANSPEPQAGGPGLSLLRGWRLGQGADVRASGPANEPTPCTPRPALSSTTRARIEAAQLQAHPAAAAPAPRAGPGLRAAGQLRSCARADHEAALVGRAGWRAIAGPSGRPSSTLASCGPAATTSRRVPTSPRHSTWRASSTTRWSLAHSLNRVGNWHVNVEQPASWRAPPPRSAGHLRAPRRPSWDRRNARPAGPGQVHAGRPDRRRSATSTGPSRCSVTSTIGRA